MPTELLILAALLVALILTQRFLRVWWFERQRFPLCPQAREQAANTIVHPVDGTVVYVRECRGLRLEVEKQGRMETVYQFDTTVDDANERYLQIGVYMSIFDRHSVLAPLAGTVQRLAHIRSGRNLPMMDLHEYIRFYYFGRLVDWFERNVFGFVAENEKLLLRCGGHRSAPDLFLVCIADRFVDKIDVLRDGDDCPIGVPIAHIRRGSQTDIFLPLARIAGDCRRPRVGQRVKAGSLLFRTS